jgi:hypothetical protein
MDNPFVNIPQECRDIAANLGRQYFWGVRNQAGDVYYEGQRDTLSVARVPGVGVLKKPITDPWGTICLTGATHGVWIPVAKGDTCYMANTNDCSHISLMRKQYITSSKDTYTAYVIGSRWDDILKEEQVHICPPTRYKLKDGRNLPFFGAVSIITAIGEKNAYEKFVESYA